MEMALWVECLPYKHAHLTWSPEHTKKARHGGRHTLGRQRQAEPYGLLINQARVLGGFQTNERYWFKKQAHGVGGPLRNGTEDVLTTFTRCVCECMLTRACVHTHTQTWIYIPKRSIIWYWHLNQHEIIILYLFVLRSEMHLKWSKSKCQQATLPLDILGGIIYFLAVLASLLNLNSLAIYCAAISSR